jgi:hypothetical protein
VSVPQSHPRIDFQRDGFFGLARLSGRAQSGPSRGREIQMKIARSLPMDAIPLFTMQAGICRQARHTILAEDASVSDRNKPSRRRFTMAEVRQDSSEESVGGLFQPDMVLASQFFGALRQGGFIEGEKRLMAAVLADAVDCYIKHAFNTERRAQHMFLEAEAWISADGPMPWFFSFNNICDMLGLEPEYIRRGLLEWRRNRRPPSIRWATPCALHGTPLAAKCRGRSSRGTLVGTNGLFPRSRIAPESMHASTFNSATDFSASPV